MLLLNFSHPITAAQQQQIEQMIGQPLQQVVTVPVQFDDQQPFVSQILPLIDSIGLTAEQWQTEAILLVPPALNFIAALILAELHGRMGYFPTIVRLRPVVGGTVRQYEVAELINLQTMRDEARKRR